MQQRQLRLGDVLDDYCPRERRLTNHAVVAMVDADVKRTRCTTCDTEHEYKHAKVPHQRRKSETPAALYSQVLANGPKKIPPPAAVPDGASANPDERVSGSISELEGAQPSEDPRDADQGGGEETPPSEEAERPSGSEVEGPVHRRLIRATLPRTDGQQPPQRPIPEFTIRQPGSGRPNRFRQRHGRGGQSFAGGSRSNGGRPQGHDRPRQGHGRKRSK
jgi:hypothetical protein